MPRAIRPYNRSIGPVIPVTVSDPFSGRDPDETLRSETVSMLVDTGASDSSIAGPVADRLGLPVLGFHDVSGFGMKGAAFQYLADLELRLDEPYALTDWKLLRFDSDYDKIQGIIGRDILARARFIMDGPKAEFVIEF